MDAALPLPALLSQALVAFTIEFDNEFEHRMPHRTTRHGAAGGSEAGPWLVSMAMWWNCMRFVGEDGVRVNELEHLARTKTNLNGMVRWGYVVIGADNVVRSTPKGRKAQTVWRPLSGEIETRWQERFGAEEVGRLRGALQAVVQQIDVELPDCMPILGYGLYSRVSNSGRPTHAESHLPLPALLARALLAFAVEFEGESEVSLAICANVLRVLDDRSVRVRDLPVLSGVSKESIATAVGFLQKEPLVEIAPERTGSATKVVRLTKKGRQVHDAYRALLAVIEDRWTERFGKDAIGNLRTTLNRLSGERLNQGLQPYPDGWRASVRELRTLPHYPMVLHRGGFPDGS